MSDYVSRDAVVKWVDDSIEMCGNRYTTEQENMMEMFRVVITDCIPAADVREVKRAQWALCAKGVVMCTNCCAVGHSSFQYCPKCGAQMRKEGGETRALIKP